MQTSPSTTPAGPIRVAVINDYELVVRGLAAMLAPHSERVTVVELDSDLPPGQRVDVGLYDTFSLAGPVEELVAAGARPQRLGGCEPSVVDDLRAVDHRVGAGVSPE